MAMTLQELLDLLPDNTTGAIDASDLRTVVTELFNQTVAVQTALNDGAVQTGSAIEALDVRVTALEDA